MSSVRAGALIIVLVAGPLAGCAQGGMSSSTTIQSTVTSAHRTTQRRAEQPRHHRATPTAGGTSGRSGATAARAGGGLAVSHASPEVVQPQLPAGSCRTRGHGRYTLPDPHCTPGAINPTVTQSTIARTICVSGWTKTVRPPERITEPEKLASMRAYGDASSPHNYAYDHLVSLELGGAVNDARNLWPEPGASPNPKDSVERQLHTLVCDGQMRPARAQHIIATGWVTWARQRRSGGSATSSSSSRPPPVSSSPSSPSSPSSGGPNRPISEINCSDFPTHAAAQEWFEAHGGSPSNDVAGLDANHDGQACTSLP